MNKYGPFSNPLFGLRCSIALGRLMSGGPLNSHLLPLLILNTHYLFYLFPTTFYNVAFDITFLNKIHLLHLLSNSVCLISERIG